MKKLLPILAVILMVGGCSVNPSEVDDEYARKYAKTITYVKDHRTGLCFGVIASRKTGTFSQSGLGITEVPCEKVDKYLIK